MIIMAVETSCDETSAALLLAKNDKTGLEVLSNIILSQDEIHAPYGGVVPELASRQHIKTIDAIIQESLSRARVSLEAVDLYAVTQGPGLVGSLIVGLTYAKGLAYYYHKPLIGVNHLEAHLEAAFIENPEIQFPVLGLLVSGGHTSLYFMREPLVYELLGQTRDDAAGEALDKIAKFLQLGYPGGPAIERLGQNGASDRFQFAIPKTKEKSLDFSFSGFKTAALKLIRENELTRDDSRLPDFLASVEEIVVRYLTKKVQAAANQVEPASLMLCGGVARNRRLRTAFLNLARSSGLPAFIPSPKLCTDNAAMVGALAARIFKRSPDAGLKLELDVFARRQS